MGKSYTPRKSKSDDSGFVITKRAPYIPLKPGLVIRTRRQAQAEAKIFSQKDGIKTRGSKSLQPEDKVKHNSYNSVQSDEDSVKTKVSKLVPPQVVKNKANKSIQERTPKVVQSADESVKKFPKVVDPPEDVPKPKISKTVLPQEDLVKSRSPKTDLDELEAIKREVEILNRANKEREKREQEEAKRKELKNLEKVKEEKLLEECDDDVDEEVDIENMETEDSLQVSADGMAEDEGEEVEIEVDPADEDPVNIYSGTNRGRGVHETDMASEMVDVEGEEHVIETEAENDMDEGEEQIDGQLTGLEDIVDVEDINKKSKLPPLQIKLSASTPRGRKNQIKYKVISNNADYQNAKSMEMQQQLHRVDKDDPRSRLHFVKYMKKDGKTIKIWECGICAKEFRHQYTLMRHLPTHTDERNFKCESCGKAFRQMSTLSQHRAIHSDARPYVCEFCQKTFNRVSTLISHRKTHSEEKPHKCTICGTGFHQKGNLRNHVYTHTNERPYKCEDCGKGFNQMSNLMCHKAHQHAEKSRYFCQICNKEFPRKFALKSHEEYKHGIKYRAGERRQELDPNSFKDIVSKKQRKKEEKSLRIIHLPNGDRTLANIHEIKKGHIPRAPLQKIKITKVLTPQEAQILRNKDRRIGMEVVAQEDIETEVITPDILGQGVLPTARPPGRIFSSVNNRTFSRTKIPSAKSQSAVASSAAGVIIDPIETKAMLNARQAGQTPFALLKPAKGIPVLVKVTPAPNNKQMLVPATADDLKTAGKITVSPSLGQSNGNTIKAVQIKVPVVATVIQKLGSDGQLIIQVEPPGPEPGQEDERDPEPPPQPVTDPVGSMMEPVEECVQEQQQVQYIREDGTVVSEEEMQAMNQVNLLAAAVNMVQQQQAEQEAIPSHPAQGVLDMASQGIQFVRQAADGNYEVLSQEEAAHVLQQPGQTIEVVSDAAQQIQIIDETQGNSVIDQNNIRALVDALELAGYQLSGGQKQIVITESGQQLIIDPSGQENEIILQQAEQEQQVMVNEEGQPIHMVVDESNMGNEGQDQLQYVIAQSGSQVQSGNAMAAASAPITRIVREGRGEGIVKFVGGGGGNEGTHFLSGGGRDEGTQFVSRGGGDEGMPFVSGGGGDEDTQFVSGGGEEGTRFIRGGGGDEAAQFESEGGEEAGQIVSDGGEEEEEEELVSKGDEEQIVSDGGEEEEQIVSDGGEEEKLIVSDGGEEEKQIVSKGGEKEEQIVSNRGEEDKQIVSDGGEEEEQTVRKGGEEGELIVSNGGEEEEQTVRKGGEEEEQIVSDKGEEEKQIVSKGGEEEEQTVRKGGEEEEQIVSDKGEEEKQIVSKGGEEEEQIVSDGGEEEEQIVSDGGEEEEQIVSDGGEEHFVSGGDEDDAPQIGDGAGEEAAQVVSGGSEDETAEPVSEVGEDSTQTDSGGGENEPSQLDSSRDGDEAAECVSGGGDGGEAGSVSSRDGETAEDAEAPVSQKGVEVPSVVAREVEGGTTLQGKGGVAASVVGKGEVAAPVMGQGEMAQSLVGKDKAVSPLIGQSEVATEGNADDMEMITLKVEPMEVDEEETDPETSRVQVEISQSLNHTDSTMNPVPSESKVEEAQIVSGT